MNAKEFLRTDDPDLIDAAESYADMKIKEERKRIVRGLEGQFNFYTPHPTLKQEFNDWCYQTKESIQRLKTK